jgi:hypothetical protein
VIQQQEARQPARLAASWGRVGRLPAILGDPRGSLLVSALMVVFVATALGVALFELSVVDNRLILGSGCDVRANVVDDVDPRVPPGCTDCAPSATCTSNTVRVAVTITPALAQAQPVSLQTVISKR